MYVWKGRIKRALALILAFSLVCKGANSLMLFAAENKWEKGTEDVVTTDQTQEDNISGEEHSQEREGEKDSSDEKPFGREESGENISGEDFSDSEDAEGENGTGDDGIIDQKPEDGAFEEDPMQKGEESGNTGEDSSQKEEGSGSTDEDSLQKGEGNGISGEDPTQKGEDGNNLAGEDPSQGEEAEDDRSGEDPTQKGEDGNSISEEDISGNEEPENTLTVDAVKALVSALPTPEEVAAQSPEEQRESYLQVCDVYAAYNGLTEEQKLQVEGAEEIFALLFACYGEPEQPEVIAEAFDLSDWIFQEGGLYIWPDEPMAVWTSDGDVSVQAESNPEGAKGAVLTAMRNWNGSVDISIYNISIDEMNRLMIDLINFNPELFYVDVGNCRYSYDPTTGMAIGITLAYNTYTAEDVQAYRNALEKAYTEAITDDSMTDIQKARALHDYLVQHMQYDASLQRHDAYNALVEGIAVCQGYSLAYGALLAKAGISFDYCSSDAMNHMWNYVLLDGNWYHVDVTWDDPTPDRVGIVRYRYFLCSDTQMNSEGAGGHYAWVSARTCTSQTYDDAYWKDWSGNSPLSAIFSVDGGEYYLRSANSSGVSVMCRRNDMETTVCSVPARWSAGGNSYWTGHFSGLSYYNGMLYFNGPEKIYALQPGSTEPAVVYTYEEGNGSIYGSLICKNQIVMGIANDPNSSATRKTVPLTNKDESRITNKTTDGYPTAYVYNRTAIAAPQASQFETNTDGVLTFEWYQGSVAAGNKLNAAPSNAGSYILRVMAAETPTHLAAVLDLPVTIAPKEVKITVTAENKVYDGTANAKVTASVTEGVLVGDTVNVVNLTGAFTDKNVGNNKSVTLTGGSLSGTGAANYTMTMPAGVTASISAKPITVIADNQSKTYGESDPKLSYTVSDATPLVSGESLTGELKRAAGENAGTYAITQGTLTTDKNPNYDITFTQGTFTINPAEYKVSAVSFQSIFEGIGTFTEPVFVLNNGDQVPGIVSYTYSGKSYTYDQLVEELKKLALDTAGEIVYSFTPNDSVNYKETGAGTGTGRISFEVRDIEFLVGGTAAGLNNAVTLKTSPVYGDTWAEIVQIGNITARAGNQTDSEKSHFTLNVSDVPDAGERTFQILYNGTLNGKDYNDKVVCVGTVKVEKKVVAVSAGSYKVSKIYDGTTAVGNISGALKVSGILNVDTGVNVTAAVAGYNSPNVGGQNYMTATLTLNGDTKGNYVLEKTEIEVPCEISPKSVTPVLEVTGSYQYTGAAIIPSFTVSADTVSLTGADYTVECVDNINAGTGKVRIHAKAGSNYTWAEPAEAEFTIAKAVYSKSTEESTAVKFGNKAVYDLTSFLPEGYELGEIQVEDEDVILEGAPVVGGEILSFQLVYDINKVGKSAKVTIPVINTRNYEPYRIVITIEAVNKLEQTGFRFAESEVIKVYGSEEFTIPAVGVAEGSKVTYTSSDANVAVVDVSGRIWIHGTGTVKIGAVASETADYFAAEASYTLTVLPKELSWDISGLEAADREGNVKNNKAGLYGELKVSGIIASDTGEVSFTCPADRLIGQYDGVNPGERRVVLSWAAPRNPVTLQGEKAENYVLPNVLPELTGRINAVSTNAVTVPESTENVKYVLKVENGISEVPESLRQKENLNMPSKMEGYMRQILQDKFSNIAGGNTKVYDMLLMVCTDNANWEPVTEENFPKKGLTITVPYPEGTSPDTHDYFVSHLFTADMNGYRAGETEYPDVKKTKEGISFVVHGLSPISIGWISLQTEPETPKNSGTSNNQTNPKDPGAPNNQITPEGAETPKDSVASNNRTTRKPSDTSSNPTTPEDSDTSENRISLQASTKPNDLTEPDDEKTNIQDGAGSTNASDNTDSIAVTGEAVSTEIDGKIGIIPFVILFAVAVVIIVVLCVVRYRKYKKEQR